MESMATKELDMDYSKYDFKDSTEVYAYLSKKGLWEKYSSEEPGSSRTITTLRLSRPRPHP